MIFILKEQKEKGMCFCPEFLIRKSPITLINAPWGSGKTYFVETLIKNFLDEKVKSLIFEKIIILDVWKYSDSKDVQNIIMIELFQILSETNQKIKSKLLESFKIFSNTVFIPQLNNRGFDFKKFEENYENIKNFFKRKI